MGLGSVVGAVVNELLVGLVTAATFKLTLGVILIVSAVRIFRKLPLFTELPRAFIVGNPVSRGMPLTKSYTLSQSAWRGAAFDIIMAMRGLAYAREAAGKGEKRMHVAMRQYQVDPGSVDEIIRGVNEGLLPIIKDVHGFQAYYAVNAGGGRLASVSVFEDRAGAEESTRMAADWIRQNMASLFPNPPEVLQGEVVVYDAASAGPVSGVTDTVGGVTDTVGGATDPVRGVTDKLLGGGGEKQR